MKDDYSVKAIPAQETYEWILKKHYAHRIPSISYAFGLYENNILAGICTFGSTVSQTLNKGIAGEYYQNNIIELNRLCVESNEIDITSWFVSRCLRAFDNKIIVSFADTKQGHVGKIYQACNFIYTGLSADRSRWALKGNDVNHNHRAITQKYTYAEIKELYSDLMEYKKASRKHRYLYMCGNKKFKREVMKALIYPICEYPKGETKRYDASYKPITQGVLF